MVSGGDRGLADAGISKRRSVTPETEFRVPPLDGLAEGRRELERRAPRLQSLAAGEQSEMVASLFAGLKIYAGEPSITTTGTAPSSAATTCSTRPRSWRGCSSKAPGFW